MIDPNLIAAVHDEASLLALLRDGLGWPILDVDRATRRVPQIADGIDHPGGEVSVRRLRPTSAEDARPVFLVDFEGGSYLRRDLRALLRSVRGFERETSGVGATGVGDTLYVVAQEGWRDVRFVLFRPRPSGAPEIRSFGWRDGRPGRTALETNLPGLAWGRRAAWQDAFNVEGLTEAFYEAFRRDFDAVKGEIVIRGTGGEVETNDARNEARRHEWTQLLFNRLLFVAFVERMGWFRRPDGSFTTDYLHDLYRGRRGGFRTYLGMLRAAFEELDTPDDAAHKGAHRAAIGTVPYLNGGLFAPDGIDVEGMGLPDSSFERILGGPDALFRRYNFTVTESSPLDQEVAVDPEMLGKIFERLVNDRHAEGKYYTPRPIVGFMVDEAIKGYLVEGGLAPEKAALLEEEERLRAEDGLVHLDADEVGPIRERLMAVRAVDPACGSGAYLLGLLQKLFGLVDLLNLGSRNARDLYRTKLALLQRCVYGVDLDPTAVRIARLRLWLSLTVENPEGYKPEPLPNLDFRIESGDSLACPVAPPQPELYRDQLVRDFRDAKLAYANARPEDRAATRGRAFALRDELRANVAHATPLMAASRNPFDWTVEFAEVFVEEAHPATMDGRLNLGMEVGRRGQGTFAAEPPRPGGFDIVLANPPYVSSNGLAKIGMAYKAALVKGYGTGTGTADLLVYFFERAHQLLRPGGQLAFITSNKWLRASYGVGLRTFFASEAVVTELLNYNGNEVFRGLPDAMPLITLAVKARPRGESLRYTSLTRVPADDLPLPIEARARHSTTIAGGLAARRGEWALPSFTDGGTVGVDLRGTPLRTYVGGRIYYGIKTGLNEVKIGSDGRMYGKAVPDGVKVVRKEGVFVIDGAKRAELIAEDPRSAEIIKPLAVGQDVRAWHIEPEDRWIIVTKNGTPMDECPAIMRHLERYQDRLVPRADQGEHWWNLRACAYYAEFDSAKIMIPELAEGPRAALAPAGLFINNSGFIIGTTEPLFLLGLMNSSPVISWYRGITPVMKDDFIRFNAQCMERIPIPPATSEQRSEIEGIVRQILDLKAADPNADVAGLEAEIDRSVERLYFGGSLKEIGGG